MFNLLKWIGYGIVSVLLFMVFGLIYFGVRSVGEHDGLHITKKEQVRVDTIYIEKVIHDTVIIYQKPKELIQPVQTTQQPVQTQIIDTIKSNESGL